MTALWHKRAGYVLHCDLIERLALLCVFSKYNSKMAISLRSVLLAGAVFGAASAKTQKVAGSVAAPKGQKTLTLGVLGGMSSAICFHVCMSHN